MVLSARVYLCVHGFCCSLYAFGAFFVLLWVTERDGTAAVGFYHAACNIYIEFSFLFLQLKTKCIRGKKDALFFLKVGVTYLNIAGSAISWIQFLRPCILSTACLFTFKHEQSGHSTKNGLHLQWWFTSVVLMSRPQSPATGGNSISGLPPAC